MEFEGIQNVSEMQLSSLGTVYSILWGRNRLVGIATRFGWTVRHSSNFPSPKPVQNCRGVHPASFNGDHGSSGRKAAEAWC
jgi:hypothetical protein